LKKLNWMSNPSNFINVIILILIYAPPILSLKMINVPLEIRYPLVVGMIKIFAGLSIVTLLVFLIVTYIGLSIFGYNINDYFKLEK